jgi:SAM-dependent methyltransferase
MSPGRPVDPEPTSLRESWEAHAGEWLAWAGVPGHDSYWRFHREAFFALLPAPGRLTVDVGCGQGRVTADLVARGHTVVGVDGSPTLAAAAADRGIAACVGDAASLPLGDGVADCVVCFMVLQDVDRFAGAIAETARVLRPGGRMAWAVVHPVNSAGRFEPGPGSGDDPAPPFVIRQPYYRVQRYADEVERDGLVMTFHSEHRPLQDYAGALADAGFVIERLIEPTEPDPDDPWYRMPLFLDVVCRLEGAEGPG